LVEGGQVEGFVYFSDPQERGLYFALYKPSLFDAARGVWGFDV
jgi:hypothetical protein